MLLKKIMVGFCFLIISDFVLSAVVYYPQSEAASVCAAHAKTVNPNQVGCPYSNSKGSNHPFWDVSINGGFYYAPAGPETYFYYVSSMPTAAQLASKKLQYDSATKTFISNIPVCSDSQDPITYNCGFLKGFKKSCFDGSSVLENASCLFQDVWQQLSDIPHDPVVDACISGDDAACKIYNADLFAMVLSFSPLGASGKLQTMEYDALNKLWTTIPLEIKASSGQLALLTSLKVEVPSLSFGQALQAYVKAVPNSAYATGLVAAAAASIYKYNLSVEPNTGVVSSVDAAGNLSTLTSNELLKISDALVGGGAFFVPLDKVTPFVDVASIPWVAPAIPAINGDFSRVYNPDGSQVAENFPLTSPNSGAVASGQIPATPLATLDHTSPTVYPITPPGFPSPSPDPSTTVTPDPSTSVQTKPLTNADGSTSIETTTTTQNKDGTKSISKTTVTTMPDGSIVTTKDDRLDPITIPNLVNDKTPFFDFLKTTNPYRWNPSQFLPSLPAPSCTYEIHKTITVFGMTSKPFDIAPCVPLEPLRAVLGWAFGVLTSMRIFFLIFKSTAA